MCLKIVPLFLGLMSYVKFFSMGKLVSQVCTASCKSQSLPFYFPQTNSLNVWGWWQLTVRYHSLQQWELWLPGALTNTVLHAWYQQCLFTPPSRALSFASLCSSSEDRRVAHHLSSLSFCWDFSLYSECSHMDTDMMSHVLLTQCPPSVHVGHCFPDSTEIDGALRCSNPLQTWTSICK